MKNKKSILLVIILMAVGFAAVSTTLFINGQTKINPNQEDFNVYYSDAYVNGTQDKSVIEDNTHIVFETELSTLGEKYVLDYEVTNGSKNYDAELVMECTGDNEYLTVTNDFDTDTILKAKDSREGKLTLELTKSNAGEDVDVTISCTISANAIERTSLGISNRTQITVEATDENNKDLKAKAYEITGTDEEQLLNSLVDTGFINDINEVDALVEVESDDFDNIATTTFDVSSIASEGDKVVILHFDEEKQEWEYISEETVDANGEVTANFTSYSPVAFIKVNENKELESLCAYEEGQTWTYDYLAEEQVFNTSCKGVYKIEIYGAAGGDLAHYSTVNYEYNSGTYNRHTVNKTLSSGGTLVTIYTDINLSDDISIKTGLKPASNSYQKDWGNRSVAWLKTYANRDGIDPRENDIGNIKYTLGGGATTVLKNNETVAISGGGAGSSTYSYLVAYLYNHGSGYLYGMSSWSNEVSNPGVNTYSAGAGTYGGQGYKNGANFYAGSSYVNTNLAKNYNSTNKELEEISISGTNGEHWTGNNISYGANTGNGKVIITLIGIK